MAVHTLSSSPNPSVLNLKFTCLPSLTARFRSPFVTFSSRPTKLRSLNPVPTRNFHGFSGKIPELLLLRRKVRVCAAAKDDSGGGDGIDDEAEKEARGESTLPVRFRYLAKEAPDPPLRWPWFVGTLFSFLSSFCLAVEKMCCIRISTHAHTKEWKKEKERKVLWKENNLNRIVIWFRLQERELLLFVGIWLLDRLFLCSSPQFFIFFWSDLNFGRA